MPANQTAAQLVYASVQMAAEADLEKFMSGQMTLEAAFIAGNNRNSVFTAVDAAQLAREWTVVAHQPNTDTGFSGTVFRYEGNDDPARGLVKGQLVLSFRSTEFADDAARDGQATNAMEIKPYGWAFGQIADMEAWYAHLKADGVIKASDTFAVTGYSLGGHLATAFNQLRTEDTRATGAVNSITATYTFNGAGVGELDAGVSLTNVIRQFDGERNLSHAAYFGTAETTQLYSSLAALMRDGSASGMTEAFARVTAARNAAASAPESAQRELLRADTELLFNAVDRARRVFVEAQRVQAGIASGDSASPSAQLVNTTQIAAIGLDYQIALLRAQTMTRAFQSGVIDGLGLACAADRAPSTLAGAPPIYDIYGAPLPSAVANSQHHYGVPTPVFIEDQPLFRGNPVGTVASGLLLYGEVKLLDSDFALNDFGDTHSLVLLVDSLAVQSALSRLMPSVTSATLNTILQSASNLTRTTGGGANNQGRAEGDVLENVVNALSRIFMGPSATPLQNTGRVLEGGTWANLEDRNALHNQMQALQRSAAFTSAAGRCTLSAAAGASLASSARTDFSAFLSLITLSPFALRAASDTDAIALEASLAANWGTLRTDWITDKNAVAAGQSAQNFSDVYLNDRQAMLQWQTVRNLSNIEGVVNTSASAGVLYTDATSGTVIRMGNFTDAQRQPIWFGGSDSESRSGNGLADHLYGAAGNDTLIGLGGADWLEGQSGADSLLGGVGADILLGGNGNDTLDGGEANDLLLGGADEDTYTFSGAFGTDVIEDAGGAGNIQVAGIGNLNGADATKFDANTWQTDDKSVTYSLVQADAIQQNLVITLRGNCVGSIVVRNWSAGQMGINLANTAASMGTSATLQGDIIKMTDDTGQRYIAGPNGNYRSAGSQGGAADVLAGTSSGEAIFSLSGNDGVQGAGGNDFIDGGSGDDLLMGGAGADTIYGGEGDDEIFGSADGFVSRPLEVGFAPPTAAGQVISRGFSWVVYAISDKRSVISSIDGEISPNGEGTGNFIDGGAGNDRIAAGSAADVAHGGDGNDTILGLGQSDMLYGDAGNDSMRGDGYLNGGGWATAPGEHGDDMLSGGAGNDTLIGQGGDDQLFGGVDDDYLWGDDNSITDTPIEVHGADYLDGGSGNDLLFGGGRDDQLFGEDGNDFLRGDDVVDRLPAAAHGNDYLDGGAGDDTLFGDAGEDQLSGGSGNDILLGDGTAEELPLISHGNDVLDGGSGDDHLEGNGGDDLLFGGVGNDVLLGGEGNDYLVGSQGRDALFGDVGNDTLVSDGSDYLAGGEGDDLYVFESFANGVIATIEDHFGNNTLQVWGATLGASKVFSQNGQMYLTTASNFIALSATTDLSRMTLLVPDSAGGGITLQGLINAASPSGLVQSATITPDGGAVFTRDLTSAQNLIGDQGANWLEGGSGLDELDGGDGNDLLEGGAGADALQGGGGADTLRGGAGDDSLTAVRAWSNDAESDVYQFGRGDGFDFISSGSLPQGGLKDVIRFDMGITRADISATALLTSDASNAPVRLTISYGGNDRIALDTGVEATIDRLEFADGTSMSMADVLALVPPTAAGTVVTEGDDFIRGTDGNDILRGGGGDDTLVGGAGDDILYGDSGRNTYRFTTTSGHDAVVISDVQGGVLAFEGINASDIAARMDGRDLILLSGSSSSVQVRNFGSYATDIADAWQVVGEDGHSMSLAALLAASQATPTLGLSLQARRQRFLSDQQIDLRTSAQRAFLWGPSVPRNSSILDVTVESTGTLVVPDYLDESEAEITVNGTYRRAVFQTISVAASTSSARFLPISRIASGQTLPQGATPVYVPRTYSATEHAGSVASESISGYWVPAQFTPATTAARVIGYQDVPYSYTRLVAMDTVTQARVIGSDANDTVTSFGLAEPAQFRGSIESGGGDDLIRLVSYQNGQSGTWYGQYYDMRRDIGRYQDWGPADYFYSYFSMTGLYERGRGAWISTGTGNDTVMGTDGDDVIIGGAGSDLLDGQAGSDTYLIGRESGSIDHIADVATFRPSEDFLFLAYGGHLDRIPQDTIEFDGTVDRSQLSGRWVRSSESGPYGNWGYESLELLQDGELFLQIDYAASSGRRGMRGSAGIERFVFGDGQEWTLEQLLENIPVTPAPPSPIPEPEPEPEPEPTLPAPEPAPAPVPAPDPAPTPAPESPPAEVPAPTPSPQPSDGQPVYLVGGESADVLIGTASDEEIYGESGDDVIDGGGGDDYMQGGAGSDIYLFGRGSGHDGIYNLDDEGLASEDIVKLGADITPSDVRLSMDGSSAVLSIRGAPDTLRLEGVLDDAVTVNAIEFEFQNGMRWDLSTIRAQLLLGGDEDENLGGYASADLIEGRGGNDLLFGREGEDTMRGGSGQDILYGEGGDDVLDGGAGADVLEGNEGSDVYRFGRGYGADQVYDSAGTSDSVEFLADVSIDQIWLREADWSLEVGIIGTDDRMLLRNWYSDSNRIESLRTADGHVLLDSQVNSLVEAMAAFVPPPMGTTTLPPDYREALGATIVAGWQSGG